MRPAAIYLMLSVLLLSVSAEPVFAADDTGPAAQADIAFWESVRDSRDPSELEAYLKAFPQGRFAPLATIRLKRLKDTGAAPDTPPAAPLQSGAPSAAPPVRAEAQPEIPKAPQAQVRGWIGAEIRSITAARAGELGLAGPGGAEVLSLVSFGPAAAAGGLKPGDVILACDGEPVRDNAHLIRLISAIAPPRSTSLAIRRAGVLDTVTITIRSYFEDQWAAAHRGDPLGMVNLGSAYADGALVPGNLPEARKWLERAADGGSVLAMRTLAERYESGRGFAQNDREAFAWYSRAAAAGDGDSMNALALFYVRGRAVPRDPHKAAEWAKRGAALGHPAATQNYALSLWEGWDGVKNQALGVEQFRVAAKLGRPEAFLAIGRAYYAGHGVPKNLAEALSWYREAVKQGNLYAHKDIAQMYERGEGGLPKDRAEAIRNYRKAAEINDPEALARLKALKATRHDPEEVQRLLAALGFDAGPRPGPRTRDAIRAFQQSQGLPVDGTASLRLVGQLRKAMEQKAAATAAKTVEPAPVPPDLGKLEGLEKLDTPQ